MLGAHLESLHKIDIARMVTLNVSRRLHLVARGVSCGDSAAAAMHPAQDKAMTKGLRGQDEIVRCTSNLTIRIHC